MILFTYHFDINDTFLTLNTFCNITLTGMFSSIIVLNLFRYLSDSTEMSISY